MAPGAPKAHPGAPRPSGVIPCDSLEFPDFSGMFLLTTPRFYSRKQTRSCGYQAILRFSILPSSPSHSAGVSPGACLIIIYRFPPAVIPPSASTDALGPCLRALRPSTTFVQNS